MSGVIILSVLIITVVSSAVQTTCALNSGSQLTCGIDEILDNCPADCAYDDCPKHELQDQTPCPKPRVCPPPRCKCAFNYRRADNNTCIPTTECPPFDCTRSNEVYDSCPSFCPSQKCRDATPTDECPFFLLFVIECSPACRCIPRHWRNDGVCVPYQECPNIKTQLHQEVTSEALNSE